jgi:hypothetical protein
MNYITYKDQTPVLHIVNGDWVVYGYLPKGYLLAKPKKAVLTSRDGSITYQGLTFDKIKAVLLKDVTQTTYSFAGEKKLGADGNTTGTTSTGVSLTAKVLIGVGVLAATLVFLNRKAIIKMLKKK